MSRIATDQDRARLFAICSSLVPIPDVRQARTIGVHEIWRGAARGSRARGSTEVRGGREAAAHSVTSGDASRGGPTRDGPSRHPSRRGASRRHSPMGDASRPGASRHSPRAGASRRGASHSPSAGRRRPSGSRRPGRNTPGAPDVRAAPAAPVPVEPGAAPVPRFRSRRRARQGAERQDRGTRRHCPTHDGLLFVRPMKCTKRGYRFEVTKSSCSARGGLPAMLAHRSKLDRDEETPGTRYRESFSVQVTMIGIVRHA